MYERLFPRNYWYSAESQAESSAWCRTISPTVYFVQYPNSLSELYNRNLTSEQRSEQWIGPTSPSP